jgi:adenosylcobinamide amidohydrolase
MLTSRCLDRHVSAQCHWDEYGAGCIATVGLSNALRIGDPPGRPKFRPGTINILCWLSHSLSDEAYLEAMSVAVEARTTAVLNAGVVSARTGDPATGTGTDCIVIAAPQGQSFEIYAGKHTPLGHVIGAAVLEAVQRGIEEWLEERSNLFRSAKFLEVAPA